MAGSIKGAMMGGGGTEVAEVEVEVEGKDAWGATPE